jgi:hypothetical protein
MPASVTESLPPPLRPWVERQARRMGLPGPDDYILLRIRPETQRQDLEAVRRLARPSETKQTASSPSAQGDPPVPAPGRQAACL